MEPFDALIIGAGFAGAVCGRILADAGKRVLLLERRDHIGGNAYDCPDSSGVLIHKYGPHIFHTNDAQVYDFLSRFTRWRDYQHQVAANVPDGEGRQEFPVPFNLCSLEKCFPPEKAARLEEKLLGCYGPERKVTILELRENPDPEIAALADFVYDHVFVQYTVKQWGTTPDQIDPNTTARVPVFLSRDCRYFQDTYQGIPEEGYTRMFQRMLDHPGITLMLNTDANRMLRFEKGEILCQGVPFRGDVIYTGAVDELFQCVYGPLPYRTLDFRFETHPADVFQSHATVNYTMDKPYTRITEFKLLTGQVLPGVTSTVKEYSRAYTGAEGEIPYYAIISPENIGLYQKYAALASAYKNLHLLGRLAQYRYYNMDAIAAQALSLADCLLKEKENG